MTEAEKILAFDQTPTYYRNQGKNPQTSMTCGRHTVTFASDSVAADPISTIWTTGDKLAYTCTINIKV